MLAWIIAIILYLTGIFLAAGVFTQDEMSVLTLSSRWMILCMVLIWPIIIIIMIVWSIIELIKG